MLFTTPAPVSSSASWKAIASHTPPLGVVARCGSASTPAPPIRRSQRRAPVGSKAATKTLVEPAAVTGPAPKSTVPWYSPARTTVPSGRKMALVAWSASGPPKARDQRTHGGVQQAPSRQRPDAQSAAILHDAPTAQGAHEPPQSTSVSSASRRRSSQWSSAHPTVPSTQ